MSYVHAPVDEHAVYARKRNDRRLKMFLPEKVDRKSMNIFTRSLVSIGWMESKVYDKLTFDEALVKAKELHSSKEWYKVFILQNLYDKDGWDHLCPNCVWRNGEKVNIAVKIPDIYVMDGKRLP